MSIRERFRTMRRRRNGVTVKQAAEQLDQDEYYIQRLVELGELTPLPGTPMLFDRKDIEDLAEEQRRCDENMQIIYDTTDELNYIEDKYGL